MKLNEKCRFTSAVENSMLGQTLGQSLRGEGGESFGFLSGFPHADFHSSFSAFVSLPTIQEKADRGKKNRGGKKTHTVQSGERRKRVGIPVGGLERIWSFK